METNDHDLRSLAVLHKGLLILFWLYIVCVPFVIVIQDSNPITIYVKSLFAIIVLLQSQYLYRTARKLRMSYLTLIAVSPLVPLVGLVVLLFIASAASTVLNKGGVKLGKFGAAHITPRELAIAAIPFR